MKNIEHFDPTEFEVSSKEADIMDPAQRMLLEVSRQALEDSGLYYRGDEEI